MGLRDFFRRKSTEGGYKRPMVGEDAVTGSPMSVDFGDLFQLGGNFQDVRTDKVATVHACIQLFANAISQCEPIVKNPRTGEEMEELPEVFRKPNSYETWAQLIYNIVATTKYEGEAFVLIRRNLVGDVVEFHLMPRRSCTPFITPNGEVLYSVGTNPVLLNETQYLVPQRDIMHIRQHTPRHPLIGESDLKAAGLAVGLQVSLNRNQQAFFENMSRPSGVLQTEMKLQKEQIDMLKEAFQRHARQWDSGGLPVLSNGLKYTPLTLSAQESEVIETLKMTTAEIARAFGVPLELIGAGEKTGVSNTESLIRYWLSISLGSMIENIEQSLTRALELEYPWKVDLDTSPLLRTDLKSRVEAYTKAIQGGVMTPNEARSKENLPPVEGGNEVFLQRQMVSITAIDELTQQELNPPKPTPAPAPEPEPDMSKDLEIYFAKRYQI